MAAAFESSAKNSSLVPSTTISSASFTLAGTNKVLYVLAGASSGSPITPSAVKWGGSGGVSLTQVGSSLSLGAFTNISIWRLINPTSQTSTVHVTWGAAQDETWVIAANFQGVDQTTPNGTVATSTGAVSAAITVNATSTAGQLVVDFQSWLDLGNNGRTATVGAGQTSIEEIEGPTLGYEGAGASYETAAGTSTTMSWALSGTVDNWGTFAFALNDAGGGGGGSASLIAKRQLSQLPALFYY